MPKNNERPIPGRCDLIISTMKTTNVLFQALILVLATVFTNGCATARKPDYHPDTSSASVRVARQAGVEVALDPFTDAARTKPYFGIDAVNDGIAICHVQVSNLTSDKTFLIEKKHFQLILPGAISGQAIAEGEIDRSTAAGEAVALTGASLGSFPMLFAGAALISQSTEIRRNFVSKEMPDQTLPSGQSMQGFIYYRPVAKKVDWTRGSTMKIVLTDTTTLQTTEMTIPLFP